MGTGDRPLVSRRVAAVASILILIALIFAIYFLSWGMRAGVANPFTPPKPPPEEEKWELSPLVSQYGIKRTPIIVINCKYMLVGSDALRYGAEVERENIGKAVCTATNSPNFCSKFGRTSSLIITNFTECRGNKTLIYAFHSPSCDISSAQRDVLNAFRDEFSNQIKLEYICTPIRGQDNGTCPNEFFRGKYDK